MMTEPSTYYDRVIQQALKLNRGIIDAVVELVPRKPGLRKLSQDEQLENYLSMTPEQEAALLQQHGPMWMENYGYNMAKLMKRRLRR